MPFNSSGVYTPPAGATTAAPGDVIRSAIWNAIFTDISAALTLLGEQLYGTSNVIATPYVPITTDSFLEVNFAGAVTINLPTGVSRNGYPLRIKDVSGAANTNNITIVPNGAETIDGLASIVISDSYGGYSLIPKSTGWMISP